MFLARITGSVHCPQKCLCSAEEEIVESIFLRVVSGGVALLVLSRSHDSPSPLVSIASLSCAPSSHSVRFSPGRTPDQFPRASTPWPACDGHGGVPVSDEAAFPFNPPTSRVLLPGETAEYALRLQLADNGPRSRNALLGKLNRAVLHGVPGECNWVKIVA